MLIRGRISSACVDDIEAIDARGPGGRREERGENLDERRLAGAVRAEQAEEFAGPHFERDAVERDELGRAFAGVSLPHHRRWRGFL